MGTDEMAVVDGELRVHGIEGLRVVDASVMPQVISANLNAPTQMIAARAADFILGNEQLAPFKARFHFSDDRIPVHLPFDAVHCDGHGPQLPGDEP